MDDLRIWLKALFVVLCCLGMLLGIVAGLGLGAWTLRPITRRQIESRPVQFQLADLLALVAQLSLLAGCWSAVREWDRDAAADLLFLFVIAAAIR